MKDFYAYRTPNAWTHILAAILSITFMIVWLPFIRSAFDGASYVWGLDYFGVTLQGAGITPSFAFLIIQVALYALLIVGLYRMQNRMLYSAFLVTWWINVFGNLLYDIVRNGDTMFHGDTMNVHIPISSIVVPMALLALLITIQVIRADHKLAPTQLPWTTTNRMLLFVFLGTTALLLPLLATGEPHGITDKIGVLIAISQCFYLPFVFKPYQPKGVTGGAVIGT